MFVLLKSDFDVHFFCIAVELSCYASGYPPPRISWRRENNAILPTGSSIYRGNTLKIRSIKKEDRGTYYCVAENGVGKGTRRNVAVEVEFAPVVTVPRPRLGQALQYDMNLECHIVAYPPPAITWVKDEVALSNNQHYEYVFFFVWAFQRAQFLLHGFSYMGFL